MNRDRVYELIDAERDRQSAKWGAPHPWGAGDCSSPSVGLATCALVLMEESGEVARAILDVEPDEKVTEEVVQLAAVCVAILERDRR